MDVLLLFPLMPFPGAPGVQGQRLAAASAKLWNSHAGEWDHSGGAFIHGFRRVESAGIG